jgi:hypothetical protein
MLALTLDAVLSSLAGTPGAFAEARARRPELAPFASPLDAATTLAGAAGEGRYALVAALVAEHAAGGSSLWSSILLAGFRPMLLRLRKRLGATAGSHARSAEAREELDARVLAAFLEALAAVSAKDAGRYASAALRRGTEKALRSVRRAERREEHEASFDELEHTAPSPHAVTLADARTDAVWADAHEQRTASLSRARRPRADEVVRRSAA